MEATPIVAAVIMLAPFVAYLVNVFFGGWLKERAHWVSLTLVGISAILSLAVFGTTVWRSLTDPHFHGWHGTWFTIPAGAYTLKIGYQVDQLTAMHVADGVKLDEPADEGDDDEHDGSELVNLVADFKRVCSRRDCKPSSVPAVKVWVS